MTREEKQDLESSEGINVVEIQRFYRHSNDKNDIGWKTCGENHTIGPALQGTLDALRYGMQERKNTYIQQGGWSGDLYVVHRRLFEFQNEISRFMGDSGAGGEIKGQVYEVVINSTSGWAQYLSVVGGPFHEKVIEQLEKLDFAPKHSYLAKNDPVPFTSGNPTGLWLDNLIEIPSIMPS